MKFGFRRVRLQCVGIIAIKTVGTQVHFLIDVLVAVASLDLKVPIIPEEKWVTTRSLDKKGNVLKPRRVKQPESFKH